MKLLKTVLLSMTLVGLTACGNEAFYEGTYVAVGNPNARLTLTESSIKKVNESKKVVVDSDFNVIKAIAPLDKYAAGTLDISFDETGREKTFPLDFLNQDTITLDNKLFVREGADFDDYLSKYYGDYKFSNEK